MAMWPHHPHLLARPVPRYTSYPTAAEFHDGICPSDYVSALADVKSGTDVSLYLHIPFCEKICWYCGCNTGASNRSQRLSAYLVALKAELAMVARILGGRGRVRRIAFGGGSPNALSPVDFVRLADRIVTLFEAHDPDISVELDPRGLTGEWAIVLAAANVRRVSMGVQTLSPQVQAAIGRVQPLADIEKAVTALRLRGIDAINFDLMYGLPHQSEADLVDTLRHSIAMAPSRVALFGYAHLPTAIPRQRRIDASALPDGNARFAQAALGHAMLTEGGYQAIGFDHFALPDDPLAKAARNGRLHRNFQGFTDDDADVLLGFGASAIGRVGDLFIQNEKNSGRYRERIETAQLPVARGVRRTEHDIGRAAVIEALLCTGRAAVSAELRDSVLPRLDDFAQLGLLHWEKDTLILRPAALPYARTIAARFDAYRDPQSRAFSMAV